jgi:maltose-binding protein MalE
MSLIRRNMKLIVVGVTCVALGAGASIIATAGAATSSTSSATNSAATSKTRQRGARRDVRRLARRAVQGSIVVATKTGFATITFERGTVQGVSGQQLTLRVGTKKRAYRTETVTIPTNAVVRDDGQKATLSEVKAGQRAILVRGPKRWFVLAHNPR